MTRDPHCDGRKADDKLRALRLEVATLQGLLRRVAGPAVNYNSRVYRLTDDFTALLPYLTDEQVRQAGERPSEADSRVAAERDELQARLDAAVTALRWLPSQYTVADENALRVVSLLQDDVYRIADDLARPVSPETTP